MNKTYRLVWCDASQSWAVVPETAKSRGKASTRAKRLIATAAVLVAGAAQGQAPPINALPAGGQVVAGQATISQAGNAMTIQQASDKAILNWSGFNIGSQASVNFVQPSAAAVALNRISGTSASAIYGSLTANGNVFLVNPAGVMFGPSARVDVGGLVATSMNIRNDDFLNANYRFTRDGAIGSLVNQGELTAKYIALLAPTVRNEGIISATMGKAVLAAGDAVTLGITGNSLINVQVDQASIDTLVENKHLIRADGGTVVLSAQSAHTLLGQVVNSGAIEAQGISADGGIIKLLASSNIDHSGRITADAGANGKGGTAILLADLSNPNSLTTVSGSLSARGGSNAGDGGFIETSGTHLKIEDTARIDTSAANGKTGAWLLDPDDFKIAASGGDITGAALGTLLASNNVTIQTTGTTSTCATDAPASCGSGAVGTGNGDIFVNDAVSWGSASTLTLDAWRNIEVSQAISVTGTGGLTLKYGQQAVNSGNAAAYLLSAPINLASGATFQTQLGNDGVLTSYTIVNDRTALDTVASGADYVLGANITAGATAFTPISSFTNVFDGLGHTIDGLTINAAVINNSGMFAEVGGFMVSGGEIRNLGLTNVSVTGAASWLGGIAGTNSGSIHHSYVTGNVGSTGGTGTFQTLGGLVGSNQGSIASSYSGAAVTGAAGDNDAVVGGLVGVNTRTSGSGGSIANSYATGTVSKVTGATTGAIGGLVGSNEAGGSISNSYASASVSAGTSTRQGGLVGMNGNNDAGTDSTISNSYYNSTLYAGSGIGDDVSFPGSTVTAKTTAQLAAATVLADLGLSNVTWLRDSATGYPVLIGIVYGGGGGGSPTVIYIRLVPGSSAYGDTVNLSYGLFDAATAGTSIADATPSGTVSWTGTLPTSTSDAGSYSLTYSSGITLGNAGYSLSAGNAASWTINPRSVTITPSAGQTKVYNGLGGTDPALTYASIANQLVNSDTLTPTGALTRAAGSNVGNYAINLGNLVSGSGNYTLAINATPVNFTVTPKALTMTGLSVPASKVYDGGTTATVTGTAALLAAEAVGAGTTADGKFYTGDTVNFTGTATGTYNSKDVTTAATVTYAGLALSNANYTLTIQSPASATITPKALTVTASDASKVFGTTQSFAGTEFTSSGLVLGEAIGNVTLTSTGAAPTASVAGGPYPIVPSAATGGTFSTSNYMINYVDGALAVTPALVSTSVVGLSGVRVYDGTDIVNGSIFSVSGLVGFDTLVVTGSGTVADKNVGVNKSVTLGNLALANGTGIASNYTLTGGTHVATITKAPITGVTGLSVADRPYDGGLVAVVATSGAVIAGMAANDSLTLASAKGSFDTKNVGTAKNVAITDLVFGGVDIDNYSFSAATASPVKANITQRPLSTWKGPASGGNWSDLANWDALPDASNVAAVSLPSAGTVVYDAAMGSTNLQSMSGAGTLQVAGGSLTVANGVSLQRYQQTGGALVTPGAVTVSTSFNQSGGTVVAAGAVAITQASGDLLVGSIMAPSINLIASGGIGQSGGLVTTGLLTTRSSAATVLNSSENRVSAIQAASTGVGNIEFTNQAVLDVRGMRTSSGSIIVKNTGGIGTSGPVSARGGRITGVANSPLTIGPDGVSADGDIVLTATNLTSAGNVMLNGPVVSSGGSITLTAANNLTQNSTVSAALGVTSAAGGSTVFGPNATTVGTSVSYSSNGVATQPPVGALGNESLLASLRILNRVQQDDTQDHLATANADLARLDTMLTYSGKYGYWSMLIGNTMDSTTSAEQFMISANQLISSFCADCKQVTADDARRMWFGTAISANEILKK